MGGPLVGHVDRIEASRWRPRRMGSRPTRPWRCMRLRDERLEVGLTFEPHLRRGALHAKEYPPTRGVISIPQLLICASMHAMLCVSRHAPTISIPQLLICAHPRQPPTP